jgi:glutamate/aspartate transport system substrate-binding protein
VCRPLAAAPATAQELTGTLKKIKETGTITLGHRDTSIPFSYYDDKQQVVGYAIDLCARIVDAIKAKLKMPNLQVKLNPVTSATRIPLMANGTIDLECGSTTNNLERQKQVSFTITHFVTANRLVAKKASNIRKLDDMKGKTIVSTSGTTNMKQITELNAQRNLGMTILPAKDHAEAFLMVETGRAVAFAMDDILLYSLVANAKNPADFAITPEALSIEPYGIMLRKDDAPFKKVVDTAMINTYKSGLCRGRRGTVRGGHDRDAEGEQVVRGLPGAEGVLHASQEGRGGGGLRPLRLGKIHAHQVCERPGALPGG